MYNSCFIEFSNKNLLSHNGISGKLQGLTKIAGANQISDTGGATAAVREREQFVKKKNPLPNNKIIQLKAFADDKNKCASNEISILFKSADNIVRKGENVRY